MVLAVPGLGPVPPGPAAVRAGALAARTGTLLGLVHGLAELHRSLGQHLGLGLDGLGVAAVHHAAQGGDGGVDAALLAGIDLVAMLLQRALGGVDQAVGVVAGLDRLLALLVLGG